MPLSENEKTRVAHHLGHPNISSLATWALGIPTLTEQNSLLLRVLEPQTPNNPLIEARLPFLREILCSLDACDQKRRDLLSNAEVAKIGNIEMRRGGEAGVDDSYFYWVAALEDFLGVPRNPFSRRLNASINVRVA